MFRRCWFGLRGQVDFFFVGILDQHQDMLFDFSRYLHNLGMFPSITVNSNNPLLPINTVMFVPSHGNVSQQS